MGNKEVIKKIFEYFIGIFLFDNSVYINEYNVKNKTLETAFKIEASFIIKLVLKRIPQNKIINE
ncbi:hypothetical protein ACQRC6_03620 [Peptoniphilus sp. SGI.035]|uniref:hypothetical protein n=1 Tax=Peptoniphilus sp. SGI.035 TaxID=3420564 RepID=UPI003D062E43